MKKVFTVLLIVILSISCLACSLFAGEDIVQEGGEDAIGNKSGTDSLGYDVADTYYSPMARRSVTNGDMGENYDGGTYTKIEENEIVDCSEQNESYFSIDNNTSSYPKLRSLINSGVKASDIQADAVRVEEILNYFRYDYALPTEETFAITSSVFDSPYHEGSKLLTIGVTAKKVEFTEQKNNLVFLIDTSGSMYGSNRLGLVQNAFCMLADNLNASDRVSIVTYAGTSDVRLDGGYGYESAKIKAIVEDLEAGGSTAGADGINSAYTLAERYFIQGGNNRIILMTDGDFNVGVSSVEELTNLISEKKNSGIYLSVFGVGNSNWAGERMESLALNGNGTCSFIDSKQEAQRALVEQIGGSFVTVAKDVKAGIVFNKDIVKSFRLIGYENKQMTKEEFDNSEKDAGEIGSGHMATIVYEIELDNDSQATSLADITLRYKSTEDIDQEQSYDVTKQNSYHEIMTQDDAFVASVVEFCLLMRSSQYKYEASYQAIIDRLDALNEEDEYRKEFLGLVKIVAGVEE